MKLPDPLVPYAAALKWVAIAAILVATFVGGCNRGERNTVAAVANQAALTLEANTRANANATLANQCSLSLQEVNRETAAAEEAWNKAQRQALEAAAAAREAAAASDRRVATLNQQLARERAGCVDGERPVCGIPLR